MRFLLLLALMTTSLHADEWWAWTNLEFWRNQQTRASLFLGNRADVRVGEGGDVLHQEVVGVISQAAEGFEAGHDDVIADGPRGTGPDERGV